MREAVGVVAALVGAFQVKISPGADKSACKTSQIPVGYQGEHQYASNHVISGKYQRNYTIYIPSAYNDDCDKQWPLIIDYHGNDGTPNGQYDNSMYWNTTAGQQYIAVYPQGVGKSWQSAPYAKKGVSDLNFTIDLLAHLQAKYRIDPARVYASGKSNGGGFVDFLACSPQGNSFSAFAMASAALYNDTQEGGCPFQRAILESHGDEDHVIYYQGEARQGGTLPNITQWVEWWGQRDGCDPIADRTVNGDFMGYDVTSYSCGKYQNVVQHYQVFDLDHCWPSSSGNNTDGTKDYCNDYVLEYTPVVLDFFSKWNKTNAPPN